MLAKLKATFLIIHHHTGGLEMDEIEYYYH